MAIYKTGNSVKPVSAEAGKEGVSGGEKGTDAP